MPRSSFAESQDSNSGTATAISTPPDGRCAGRICDVIFAATRRPGRAEHLRRAGFELTRRVFSAWRAYQHERDDRQRLKTEIAPIQTELQQLPARRRFRATSAEIVCERPSACRHQKRTRSRSERAAVRGEPLTTAHMDANRSAALRRPRPAFDPGTPFAATPISLALPQLDESTHLQKREVMCLLRPRRPVAGFPHEIGVSYRCRGAPNGGSSCLFQ